MLGAAYGLTTGNPNIHFALAALCILPFWFPAWHPLDRIYNHLIRPIWNGTPLPPNPLQRRIACVIGGSINIGIGVSFLSGSAILAYILGFILVPLQIIVISTHFCVASWLYEGVLRLIGKWSPPVSAEKARNVVAAGGRLIDVREPDEFSVDHLPDAINIPLDSLDQNLDTLRETPAVLYCASGLRSQAAYTRLKQRGIDVHNLGAMSRYGDNP
jgi:rhodanese-related sulfurtransferase